MASKNEIATIAFRDLGGKAVSDFDNENSKEAKLAQDYWDSNRDRLLGKFNWGFAKKWASLAQEVDDIIDPKWDYKYALPNDYIKMSKEETEKTLGTNYEIRQKSLYINIESVKIEYIFRIEDTTKWPEWFQNVVVARLRSKWQVPLAKKGTKVVNWYQIYLLTLEESKGIDAEQSNPTEEEKGNHTDENDTWLNSRIIGKRS